MATTKPRTNTKRPAASRSVRVTTKKQGVTRKQGLVTAAILAVIGVIVVVASHAATAPNKVYAAVDGNGKASIYRVATDGSSPSSYNHPAGQTTWGYKTDLSLSRDKTKLYITAGIDRIINAANGSVLSEVTALDKLQSMSILGKWLPGDTSLVYDRNPFQSKLYSADVANNSIKTLVSNSNTKNWLKCPDVSRKGNKIAFSQSEHTSQGVTYEEIATTNIDGTGKKVVVKEDYQEKYVGCPMWSPDGRYIAYYQYDYARKAGSTTSDYYIVDLMVVKFDGTGKKQVANAYFGPASGAQYARALRYGYEYRDNIMPSPWSPGSTSVVFPRLTNNVENLQRVDINTKVVTPVTKHTSTSTRIDFYGWSSDGKIVYTYGSAQSQTTLKSVNADGTSANVLYKAATGEAIKGIIF